MDPALVAWVGFLVRYAEDWDTRFRSGGSAEKLKYFTQEYWYLFTSVVEADAKGQPLTAQEAKAKMRVPHGSEKLDQRIKDAVKDGYLSEGKTGPDRRRNVLSPTPKLANALAEHLRVTMEDARKVLEAHPRSDG